MPSCRMSPRIRNSRITCLTVLLLGSAVFGQTADPNAPSNGTSNQNASPSPDVDALLIEEIGPLRPGRTALLREGSLLVDVKGWMQYDRPMRSWRYVIVEDDASAPGYELTLLPNSILQQMIALRSIAQGQPVVFEVSGRVLVYRGQSFFLPLHAPQLIEHDELRSDETTTNDDSGISNAPPDDDSVDSIRRELQQAVGSIARSRSNDERSQSVTPGLIREGTMLVSRRGRLSRSGDGAWIFVFDADASGLADPPLTILPCLLLERMERYAQQLGGMTPIVLSGQVQLFNNHNYLYPTVFQVPRERSRLSP